MDGPVALDSLSGALGSAPTRLGKQNDNSKLVTRLTDFLIMIDFIVNFADNRRGVGQDFSDSESYHAFIARPTANR